MNKMLSLEFLIFILMAVGFLARRLRILGEEAEKTVTDLVLFIVLPCNILSSFLNGPQGISAGEFLSVLLVSVGIQLISLVYARFAFPRESPARRCSLGYAMICSNAGFLGTPIAQGVFGAPGLMLASVYLVPQRIMMWSRGLAVYSGETDRKKALRKIATHPCVIACLLGVVFMASSIPFPAFLRPPLESLAACNTPLTMMMIGMILSRIDLRCLVDRTILWFTLHRLVLMPLLVFALCRLLGISSLVTGVSVLLAAMPAGATTTMLAAKYNRDPEFATQLVVFTTLCSVPAIFLWILALA